MSLEKQVLSAVNKFQSKTHQGIDIRSSTSVLYECDHMTMADAIKSFLQV